MAAPLFKFLEIFTPKKEEIWPKLESSNPGLQPIVVNIKKMGANEELALKIIENYFVTKKARDFPYPLYIVSTLKNHNSRLQVFSSFQKLPQFFLRKNRPLNLKENQLMAKVALKQKSLQSINMQEVEPILKGYGKNHKILRKKQEYLEFLDAVEKNLRGEND